MLCAPVFIFTSGSSCLLGSPCCDCHYLPYTLHFSESMPIFFTRKRSKHENYLKSAIFKWYENGRQRFFLILSHDHEQTDKGYANTATNQPKRMSWRSHGMIGKNKLNIMWVMALIIVQTRVSAQQSSYHITGINWTHNWPAPVEAS